jgi:clan AA aspartic protease (TIGR02281 family)
VVQVRVNDRETCRLVVDTGATSTVLSPRIADRLGIQIRRAPPVVLHTAGGQIQAGWADLESVEVGGHKVGPLRVIVHESVEGADGLLGMNFLDAFRVEIRSEGPTMSLTRP